MKEWTIAVLPGDGIGPEVTAEAARALEAVAERFGLGLVMSWYAVGAAGVETAGDPLPEETRAAASAADAAARVCSRRRPARRRGRSGVRSRAPPSQAGDRFARAARAARRLC